MAQKRRKRWPGLVEERKARGMAADGDLGHILVVDDDPTMRALACVALGDLGGLSVGEAGGEQEARAAIAERQPDLVVMDLLLDNGRDGRDVWQALALPVPVVFLTAAHGPERVSLEAFPGCLGVLAKPFDPLSLADQVRALWRGRS